MTNQSDNSAPQQTVSTKGEHPPLTLNYSTALTLRVGLPSLREAVAETLLGQVLHFLSQETGDASATAETALRRARFIESPAVRSFGITEAVDEWLTDESGHHLLEAIGRDLQRRGVNAAQSTIEAWQRENQNEASTRAEAKVREMLAELDVVKTLRDHIVCLDEIIVRLERSQRTIEARVSVVNENYRRLAEYLQNITTRVQNAPAASPNGRKRELLARGYRRTLRFFGYGEGNVNAPAASPQNNFAVLERDMLSAQLQLAAFAAEREIAAEMVALLQQERLTDEELLTLVADAERDAISIARRMEATRDYGLAAGEMLLNGEELTTNTVCYLFGEHEDVSFTVLNRFIESRQAENVLGELANLRTDEIKAFVSELLNACHTTVAEKMRDFTVADALAALLSGEKNDWHAKLDAAFKATVTMDFLAAPYAKYLDPQIFAAVTYAPSRMQQTNERIRIALTRIRKSTHVNFDIKSDTANFDRLFFYCEFFCVPLDAFRFYDESHTDFEKVKTLPRFNPHGLTQLN